MDDTILPEILLDKKVFRICDRGACDQFRGRGLDGPGEEAADYRRNR